ncbi:MAG: DUF4097 family beta strand repeat-containing protein [Bacteroidota bacterium]
MKSAYDYPASQKLLLIIFLFFLGSLFSTNILADNLKLIKEKSLNAKSGESLFVDASGADIKVDSWNKEEVYVKIFGNRKAGDKMKFTIERTSEGIEVTAKKEGTWFFNWGSGYSVRIEVMVPANFNSYVETSGGDISIRNVKGKFKLDTSGGDVNLHNTIGELKVHTSGGDITLLNHSGNSNVSTSGGDIKANETTGDITASTSGGDINIEINNGKISAKTSGGDIDISYSGDNKGLYASTSGGDIKLFLPPILKATVDFETSGGSIECNFSNYKANKVTRGRLKGEFNGGGESILCKTTGGDVIVNSL